MPGFSSHSITGVPIRCPLAGTAVFMGEEAAAWGLTGCCGTERRLWHPRNGLKNTVNQTLKMGVLLMAVAKIANFFECVCRTKKEKMGFQRNLSKLVRGTK